MNTALLKSKPYGVCLILLGTGLFTHALLASPVVFTIDPAQSSVTISGSILKNTFKEQGPGSLTTQFSGTIKADVTDTSVQFTGSSLIQGLNNGSWEPQTGGLAGKSPANYGGAADSLLGSAKAAVRNIQLDLTSPALPITNNTFVSDGLLFQFLPNAGTTLDYVISSFLGQNQGSKQLAGYSTNRITSLATLTSSNGIQTLIIPVNAGLTFDLLTTGDTLLTLNGQLVATTAGSTNTTVSTAIQTVHVTNQIITLNWSSMPNQNYSVESTTNLVNWIVRATNIVAASNNLSWSTNATAAYEFFRVGH